MKIAYCLSGQPRGIKIASEYVKRNLLDKADVDVFAHSWYGPEEDRGLIQSCYGYLAATSYDHAWVASKRYINERYSNTPNAEKWPPFATVSAFYSMHRSFRLMYDWSMKVGVKYDFVIRSRYDFALNGVLPFDQMDQDKLYIPDDRYTPSHDFGNDQFAVGSMKVMTEYMSTYLYLNQFYDQGVQMIGEDMMSANLKRSGLVGERLVYMNMNHPFPPGPYNGSYHSLVREDMEKWQKS